MKFSRSLIAAAAATLLPLAALLPTSASAATGDGITGTETIMFDGFCDGMTITMPSGALGTAGTLDGVQAGCEDPNPIFGSAAPKKGEYGVTEGREFITMQTYGIYAVIRNDNTFTYYMLVGDTIFDALDGTWTLSAPGAQNATGTSSVSAALAAAADAPTRIPVPRKGPETLNITFDGFCDGMTLTNPSQGTDQRRTVDGGLTGCASGLPLMGAKGNVGGVNQSYAVTFDNGSGNYLHTDIFRDGTWVHYWLNNGQMEIFNSGTWTEGIPPQGNGLVSSTSAR